MSSASTGRSGGGGSSTTIRSPTRAGRRLLASALHGHVAAGDQGGGCRAREIEPRRDEEIERRLSPSTRCADRPGGLCRGEPPVAGSTRQRPTGTAEPRDQVSELHFARVVAFQLTTAPTVLTSPVVCSDSSTFAAGNHGPLWPRSAALARRPARRRARGPRPRATTRARRADGHRDVRDVERQQRWTPTPMSMKSTTPTGDGSGRSDCRPHPRTRGRARDAQAVVVGRLAGRAARARRAR